MKYFRQLLSAVGYCHLFNICHRDLKPENILITSNGDVKIADFGMAALHQTPDHKLKTSCGSPHYAAPELIGGHRYRGDKVDIWSLGVILYASLCGRLPFDVEGFGNDKDINPLLYKIRKGEYEMAPEFSKDAANLIWRILQVNPRDRIDMNQIWRHPLVRKYDYLDNLSGTQSLQALSLQDCGHPILRRSDINKDLFRQLWSMWHQFSEEQLIEALLNDAPNDQKLFYGLLLKYRDTQLENYVPQISYSTSDYHHIRPPALTKTYSTCHFPQPKSKGHRRQQASRFTVVSNRTEQTYDPFNASRPQHLDSLRSDDQVKVTIHAPQNDGQVIKANSSDKIRRSSLISSTRSMDSRGRLQKPSLRVYASRSSLASSTRSRGSAPYRATVGHKRGVDFSHIRKRSLGSQKNISTRSYLAPPLGRHSNNIEVTDNGEDTLRSVLKPSTSTRYIRSRKSHATTSQVVTGIKKSSRGSLIWNEDVLQLSSSLAKDCDEAFNRSSVVPSTASQNKSQLSASSGHPLREPSSLLKVPVLSQKLKRELLDARPLPPPPARSESVKKELLEARKQAELRKNSGEDSPGYLDRVVSHIDRLILPTPPLRAQPERRISSAPVENKPRTVPRPLPSIHEAYGEELSPRKPNEGGFQQFGDAKNSRIASAPEPRTLKKKGPYVSDNYSRPDGSERETIRIVNASTTSISPVRAPAPLTIRKKSSQSDQTSNRVPIIGPENSSQSLRAQSSGVGLRQQYHGGSKVEIAPELSRIDEDSNADDPFGQESVSGTIVKKRTNWFRRNSKLSDSDESRGSSVAGNDALISQIPNNDNQKPDTDGLSVPSKKKGFSIGRLFKRKQLDTGMTIGGNEMFEEEMSIQDSIAEARYHHRLNRMQERAYTREIEPQRNWLAKLFHVKPASKFICFSIAKRSARQEVTKVLRDWKRYGIRDVQVDKKRNIVFGRVGADNFLSLKEVAFAAEIMTVFEHLPHGRKAHLSVARITQERGAASSFHKVVETLDSVLQVRGVLVTDEEKKRMMVKTVNSAPR
ncbi:serine/threonine-protein kinase gin4 [Clarireedia jacksonii]